MTASELREQELRALVSLEAQQRHELWKARWSHAAQQLEDTSSIAKLRRQIARIKTIAKEKRSESGAEVNND